MNKLRTISIDLAKNSFALVALSPTGKEEWRKMLRRKQLLRFMAKLEPSQVAMEACGGAHYWAREFRCLGHRVVLLPPQHVKGYQRGQKNDYNDARALAEACLHGSIRPVRIKTVAQQDEQVFHGVRRQLSTEKVRLSNQIRGLLAEYGLVIPKGVAAFRRTVPHVLEEGENGLTPTLRQLLHRQYLRYLALSEELAWYDQQLQLKARHDEVCRRLNEVPGFGPVNSSVLKNWMGDGKQFSRGRDASAALGLVPRQHSTGGREVLLGITKRGDGYVRSLLVHGARAVVTQANRKSDPMSRWINRLVAQRGFNKAVVALANKLVRIAWVIIARDEPYRPVVTA